MKDKLIEQLEKAYQRLIQALDRIPDNQKIYDNWTKKELIAHIIGWYEEGVVGTPKILKGEKPDSFRITINNYNKRSVEKRRKMTLSKVKKEMADLHKKWLEQIKSLDEDQIIGFYGTLLGKKPINVEWMINEGISHDNAHSEELEKMDKN